MKDDLKNYKPIGWYSAYGAYLDPAEHGKSWVYADECEECSGYDED